VFEIIFMLIIVGLDINTCDDLAEIIVFFVFYDLETISPINKLSNIRGFIPGLTKQ